jgi:hypothetical protein
VRRVERNRDFFVKAFIWSSFSLLPINLAGDGFAELASNTITGVIKRAAIGGSLGAGGTAVNEVLTDGDLDPTKILLASLTGAASGAAPPKFALQAAALASGAQALGSDIIDGKKTLTGTVLNVFEEAMYGASVAKWVSLNPDEGAAVIQGGIGGGLASACNDPFSNDPC